MMMMMMMMMMSFARYNVSASAAKHYTNVIHVMWTTSEVPEQWQRSARTWLRINEKFVYCHWNHSELEAFVAEEYPWLLSTYLAYPYVIQRCDVARYLLLYRYGGTYVDLDLICLAPLSVIFAAAPTDAGVLVAPTEPFGVATEFIAVRRARDPVIRGVISGLRRAADSYWYPPLPYTAVMFRTGPVYLTRRLNCDGAERGVYVIPSKTYYSSYVHHVPGSSWHQWDGRIIYKLFLLLRPLHRYYVRLAIFVTALLLFICIVRWRRSVADLRHRCIRCFTSKKSRSRIITPHSIL